MEPKIEIFAFVGDIEMSVYESLTEHLRSFMNIHLGENSTYSNTLRSIVVNICSNIYAYY